MFLRARLNLTAWYLIIIMLISLLFSLVIYSSINQELNRFEEGVRARAQERIFFGFPEEQATPDPMIEAIATSRQRVILTLIIVNVAILIAAGGAGYFLAGLTLKPIQLMVDEQHRFVSDASHELRTPLTALRSEIEVGLRDKKLTLTEAKSLLASNLEEVVSLQSLSDNLLQLTKTQIVPLDHEAVSLQEAVNQSIKVVTPQAKAKKITLASTVGPELVEAELVSLTQLLVIVLDNAVKYSHPEGIVSLTSSKKDKTVDLLIHDEGIGIAKEDLPHIFDRFYRSDIARSKTTGGYGLGLSIAKRIVESYHGHIHITSTKGEGTTVQVSLPTV